ncbi:MAG TPA: Mur ligase family protein, partial [Polyangia bacterium]
MRGEPSRRLTGPNLLADETAAVLEVRFEAGDDPAALIAAWGAAARALHAALGRPAPVLLERRYTVAGGAGATLGFAAPRDLLYAMTEVNDWALAEAARRGGGAPPGEALASAAARCAALIAAEANPALIALAAEAARRGVALLQDDDEVTLGLGCHARSWPARALPAPAAVEWAARRAIPLALVTGTNGKTTTTRLLARITAAAGWVTGCASTEAIVVAGEVVERGDWTGPGAARRVLRDPRVEAAVLETARGGILRRGVAVDRCDVAVVTNIAEDHLDDWGVGDLATMARAKLVLARLVRPGGALVLNADDPVTVAHAPADRPTVWFSLAPAGALIRAHLGRGGAAALLEDEVLVLARGAAREPVIAAAEVPVAFGGAARFNIANALAATAAAAALGLPPAVIAAGLRALHPTRDENPARVNLYEVGGAHLVTDFAHNPHALGALLPFARRAFPGGRLIAVLGQAGDRSDEALGRLARSCVAGGVERVVLRPIPIYLRGRQLGEVEG